MKIIPSKLLNKFTNLTQGFTTKELGNVAFHVNDDIKNVMQNHQELSQLLEFEQNNLIHMKQIHSADVHIVQDNDDFTNPQSCDALITNKTSTPLMVMVADCSPILFYDEKEKLIAAVHAGRQGAFKNIIKNTLQTMQNRFNAKPQNIVVSIGASIGVCCYEVGAEIYEEAKSLHLEYAFEQRDGSYYLDVNKILKKQLLDSGINPNNLEISQDCTCCNTQKYYSYRAESQTGRFAGVIILR